MQICNRVGLGCVSCGRLALPERWIVCLDCGPANAHDVMAGPGYKLKECIYVWKEWGNVGVTLTVL